MPKTFSRSVRVAEMIHRCFARLIREEFKDPRIGMVTISSVSVTPDLKQAKIYITVFEEEKIIETVKILNKAQGFFRSQLASVTELRAIPSVRFIFDESIGRASRIMSLLESVIDR